MMAYGIQKTLVATGSPDNVLIARKAAAWEISSIILNETMGIFNSLPHVAKTAEGKPISTGDVVTVINLDKVDGGLSNVTVRGVGEFVFIVRPQVKVTEGRLYQRGAREIIVGSAIARRFKGTQLGSKVSFGGAQWTVVGITESGGSGFDSEIWVDCSEMQDVFNRYGAISTFTVKLDDPASFSSFLAAFNNDPRLEQFEPKIEQKFFEAQSEMMSVFIQVLGIFITVIFSAGATIGAMITMYAAVANRIVEIGTLRALGFRRRNILTAFLAESLTIAFAGGVIGLLLASTLQFFSISMLNFGSFSELEFSFVLSPSIIMTTLIFTLLMGFGGGFLPAIRAARLSIVNALRAE